MACQIHCSLLLLYQAIVKAAVILKTAHAAAMEASCMASMTRTSIKASTVDSPVANGSKGLPGVVDEHARQMYLQWAQQLRLTSTSGHMPASRPGMQFVEHQTSGCSLTTIPSTPSRNVGSSMRSESNGCNESSPEGRSHEYHAANRCAGVHR